MSTEFKVIIRGRPRAQYGSSKNSVVESDPGLESHQRSAKSEVTRDLEGSLS